MCTCARPGGSQSVRCLVDGGLGAVDGGGLGGGGEEDITGGEVGHRRRQHRGEGEVGVGGCVFCLLIFNL